MAGKLISNLIYALRKRLGWCPEPPIHMTQKAGGRKDGLWDALFISLLMIAVMILVLPYFIFGETGYHLKRFGAGYSFPKTSLTWFLFIFGFAMMFSVSFAWYIYYKKNPLKVRCPNCSQITDSPTSRLALKIKSGLPGLYMKCPNCGKRDWMKTISEAEENPAGWREPPTRKTEKIQGDFKSYGWSQTLSGRLFATSLFFTVALLTLLIISSEFRIQSFSNGVYFFLGVLINLGLAIVATSNNIKKLEAKGETKMIKITNWKYLLPFFLVYCITYGMLTNVYRVFPTFLPIISGTILPNYWFWWLSQVAWEKKKHKKIVISEGKARIRGRD